MAGKSNGLESTAWARAPPKRPFCERCLRAIYDPDDKTFLGRTPKRWGILFAFYAVFYAVLALMFAICMAGLLAVLDDRKPTYVLGSSLIGANPGVTSRPWRVVIRSENSSYYFDHHIDALQEFLKPYENETWLSKKEKCTKEDNYGFPESPCVFIKLNKIYGWKPDYFSAAELPADMSEDLTEFINDLAENERQQVWISCWDEQQPSTTQIDYPWGRGLPGRFFPFLNQEDYNSPLLPVQITPKCLSSFSSFGGASRMGADKPNGVVNYCRRPPQRPFLQRIQYAIWNPEDRTFLGRTGKRWGVIGLIYLVMYICIIIFFSLCMCGLLSAMDERIPYFTLADSIIGDNPGMGHRPILYEEGALIWYKASNETQVKKYVDNINEFLAPYENKTLLINQGVNQRDCGDSKPPRNEVCAFNISQFGDCSKENHFGFKNKTPCIIIKLNRIFDWSPNFYDDPQALPPEMPPDITNYINSTTKLLERRKVWVSCMGERPADVDALGPLKYWPYPGLPEAYFPYDNTPGYLSPLVAVQLLNPKLHQIINIRCRAWAKNLKYTESLKERLGSTHLEIMID